MAIFYTHTDKCADATLLNKLILIKYHDKMIFKIYYGISLLNVVESIHLWEIYNWNL